MPHRQPHQQDHKRLHPARHGATQQPESPPRIPLELIYMIIDDHRLILRRDNSSYGLLSLAHSCRALADYCRPLIFQSITIHGQDRLPPIPIPTGTFGKAERFTRLMTARSGVGKLVQSLCLIMLPGPKAHHLPSWTFLCRAYSRLTTLKLLIEWWQLPRSIRAALSGMIKGLKSLNSLEWKDETIPVDVVVQFSPPNLRSLTLLPTRRFTDFPTAASGNPAQPAIRLDSLTLLAPDGKDWFPRVVASSYFDLTSLTHLQLGSLDIRRNAATFITTALPNLTCLHLAMYGRGTHDPFDIARRLPRLQRLEFAVASEGQLSNVLEWLDKSVGTDNQSSAPLTPQVIVLIQWRRKSSSLARRDDSSTIYARHRAIWASGTRHDRWRNLEKGQHCRILEVGGHCGSWKANLYQAALGTPGAPSYWGG
ncbi:hypothetical protein BKA70DRAFT_1528200 [Coprinopsis sp. MPI-PUGE-AT-0042]|nr:hypothetical protein BKA70DRAFT_1528200 [Coprinopsis sp. MPI-PUGE-AT-0042]